MEGWFPLGCDGSRMECPRTAELEQELGEVQQGQIATDTLGYRLGQLDHRGPLVLVIRDIQIGERRYLIDLLEALPQAVLKSVLLVLRRGLRGLRLVRCFAQAGVLVSDPAIFAGTTLQPGDGQGGGIHRRRVLVLDRRCREKGRPPLPVRVIRVAAPGSRTTYRWLTNVLDPKRLPAALAARFYRMRWESECFFRTSGGVVKDVRLVSQTARIVMHRSRGFTAGVPALVGARGVGLESGWEAGGAGRVEVQRGGSAPGDPPGAGRSSKAGAAEQFCQAVTTDRTRSTGANRSQDERDDQPRRKKHVAPQPPRIKAAACGARKHRSRIQSSRVGSLSCYENIRSLKSRWNP